MKPVLPDTAHVNAKGHLVLGGCDVADLAKEFGTPLYVFDEATLRKRCRAFLQEFRSRYPATQVVYASKAFSNVALARLLQEEGLGLDVVSGGELALARRVEFPAERIYFHGNNKSVEELRMALEYRIGAVVVDGLGELELLERLAAGWGMTQDVMLRVSPGVDPHTHAHTTTGILDSKFGIPIQTGQAEEAMKAALRSPHLNLVGLHFHLGSPIFELEPYRVAIKVVLEFAASFTRQGFQMRAFSPGGGFAIAYLRDTLPPEIGEYAHVITGALREGCERHGLPLPQLVVEPGRAIVGPAGVALYTVGAIKEVPGVRTYVAVDGGMGDNIRPALYGAQYEALLANHMDEADEQRVTIAGKYCESGDVLVRDALLPPVRSGDLIAMPAAGAYAPAMSNNYNMAPRPAIVMVKDGKARLIRRRETYEDLMASDVL
ncbi:MAG: diaminopimelate decarboxylase [Dehalococcoidia bacterium]|nr:diaminopimelate decarboxylase [Dehalococcoidia bacterium]